MPAALGDALAATTETFSIWKDLQAVEDVRAVDELLQLVAKAAVVVCTETAPKGHATSEMACNSLTAVSIVALALTDHCWQFPLGNTQILSGLVEGGQVHIIHKLLELLDERTCDSGITLRVALKQRLEEALSDGESGKTNKCHSSIVTAILHVAHLEHTMALLLLIVTPALLRQCTQHRLAAVRKSACTCLRVLVQLSSPAAQGTGNHEAYGQLQRWSAKGLVTLLTQGGDCAVRISACHEARVLLTSQINGVIHMSDAGSLLLDHLGAVAGKMENKRILVAASKDLITVSSAIQSSDARGRMVRH